MTDHPSLAEQRALSAFVAYSRDLGTLLAERDQGVAQTAFEAGWKAHEAAFAQPPASGVDRVLPPGVNCSECGHRHFAAYTGDCVNCGAKEADFAALTNSGAPVPGDLRKRAEDLFNLIYAHTVVKYDPAAGIRCCEKALAHAAPAPSDEIDCELCDGVMSRACPRCNPCADEPEAGVPAGMVLATELRERVALLDQARRDKQPLGPYLATVAYWLEAHAPAIAAAIAKQAAPTDEAAS